MNLPWKFSHNGAFNYRDKFSVIEMSDGTKITICCDKGSHEEVAKYMCSWTLVIWYYKRCDRRFTKLDG